MTTNRTRVGHCKRDETDVYAGRGPDGRDMTEADPGERGWLGNPFPVEDHDSRAACIEAFKATFVARLKTDPEYREAVADLAGKRLGCWCQTLADDGPPCHAEVIAEWAERLAADGDARPDGGRRAYVSPDERERRAEALDHREQAARHRTIANDRGGEL